MSHNIADNNKVFVTGEPAWHGLGRVVETAQTAKQAIELAGLDYGIEKREIFFTSKNIDANKFLKHSDNCLIVRKDNDAVLGITTPKYQIIQNSEAFNFFDVVVGEGQAIYHTAGALGKGERIWILAKLPKNIVIGKDDVVEQYLCLTNSHDGKSSLRMYFTPIRVVCQNTLNMSMQDAKNGISMRHTGNIINKVEESLRVLGISINYYQQFEKIIQQFEETPFNVEQANKYFDTILGVNDSEEVSTRKGNQKDELLSLFEHGKLLIHCSLALRRRGIELLRSRHRRVLEISKSVNDW
jgi:phage/plasmid-like protein (TIGR03299 family)